MRAAAVITTACAVLWVATLTSCSHTPSAPSVADVTRVEIIAPSTLAPGATTQLRLLGHRSDGVLAITPDGIETHSTGLRAFILR